MRNDRVNFRSSFLILVLTLTCSPVIAQTPIPNPLLILQDSASDTATLPLLSVQGGNQSSTQGIEVTSQSTGTSTPPNFSTLMGTGFGGLLMVQNSPAVSGTGQGSPFFCISGNQWNGAGSTSVAAVWCLNVKGGNAAGSTDSPDVIQWTRPFLSGTYGNPTNDLTMLWPGAINLAANGQITVGPNVSSSLDVSNIPSTFTGQKTTNAGTSTTTPAAGPITIEPGQLTAGALISSTGLEGALQILQGYIAGTSTTVGRLACPSGTAQSAKVCATTGAAENWVGVFNSIPGAQGVTVTPLRYGRVGISTNSSGLVFNNGDFICKDDSNASFVIDSGSTPCLIGESVGIAVGDPSPALPNNEHLVDLVQEASVSGAIAQGLVLQLGCSGTVAASTTVYLAGQPCSTGSVGNSVEFTLPYQSGTYTFSHMYVNYGTAGLSGDTATLFVNGASTAITCTPTSAHQCSDLTHTVSISGTQNYSVRLVTQTADTLKNVLVTIQLQ